MPSNLPRITAYLSKEAHQRLRTLSKTHGVSQSRVVEALINGAFPDKRDWIAQQSGHQTMLTLALVTALAKRTLTEDELAKVRHMGAQADVMLFDPLEERPFYVDYPPPEDDLLLALWAAVVDGTASDAR
tara:strand:+ start:37454 stop:37843 length:390 start_codon:yes stop_codon:yes gene_type:complete